MITKPFLMLSLLLYYISASPDPKPILIAALVCCWIGDILLMKTGDVWFLAGGSAFIAAHILLMIMFFRSDIPSGSSFFILAVIEGIYLCISAAVVRRIGSAPGGIIRALMVMYLLINSATNIFALSDLMSFPADGTALAYAGAVLFFLSDCSLFLVMYCEDPPLVYRKNFTVMITYIFALLLIVAGDLAG